MNDARPTGCHTLVSGWKEEQDEKEWGGCEFLSLDHNKKKENRFSL